MPLKKQKSFKQMHYLNNVDIPLSKSGAKVLKAPNDAQHEGTHHHHPPPIARSILKNAASAANHQAPATNKYKQPELHSTLGVSKQIETVRRTHTAPITNIGQLTPRTKKFVKAQITKKLNHQYDERTFKALTPVNVNDSVLLQEPRAALKNRCKFQDKKELTREPVLSDYLKPIPRFSHDFTPYIPTLPLPRAAAGDGWNNFDNIMRVFALTDTEH
ncbi:uncharacterized protein LOC118457875 [Anopheles albimanus]|uniref:Protein phosphatase 1 regulatory subunit 35 C-terminal domain-containing protein n=1 Tax=Anopheles albimanus TaxID=7167 RepID=A0A182F2Q1_ANOAL|nr:uncharacterized protein LOC118457875 [Anopheles albimanus]